MHVSELCKAIPNCTPQKKLSNTSNDQVLCQTTEFKCHHSFHIIQHIHDAGLRAALSRKVETDKCICVSGQVSGLSMLQGIQAFPW